MTDDARSPASGFVLDRREVILNAAGKVLLRYGYRKASVDAVARAAGVSRQGVYLHFPTKDALFAATIEHLLDQSVLACRVALGAEGVPLEERLLDAFEAMAGETLASHLDEVLDAAERLTGRPAQELEGAIVAEFISALERSPAASPWRRHGDPAVSVAVLLYATSDGCKRHASSTSEYVEQMRHAIKFICSP